LLLVGLSKAHTSPTNTSSRQQPGQQEEKKELFKFRGTFMHSLRLLLTGVVGRGCCPGCWPGYCVGRFVVVVRLVQVVVRVVKTARMSSTNFLLDNNNPDNNNKKKKEVPQVSVSFIFAVLPSSKNRSHVPNKLLLDNKKKSFRPTNFLLDQQKKIFPTNKLSLDNKKNLSHQQLSSRPTKKIFPTNNFLLDNKKSFPPTTFFFLTTTTTRKKIVRDKLSSSRQQQQPGQQQQEKRTSFQVSKFPSFAAVSSILCGC